MYWTWAMKTGPRSSFIGKQKTKPKRSQLTTSNFYSQQYDIEDQLSQVSSNEDIESVVESIDELYQETEESLDNMPESLKYSPTGELLQERIDALDEWRNELDQLEEPERDDYDSDEEHKEAFYEYLEEAKSAELSI